MTLDADEFIRRFLLHTLPDGFHRIRHYGFLANGHRAAKLALCRKLLKTTAPSPAAEPGSGRPSSGTPRPLPLLRRRHGPPRHAAAAAAMPPILLGQLMTARHSTIGLPTPSAARCGRGRTP